LFVLLAKHTSCFPATWKYDIVRLRKTTFVGDLDEYSVRCATIGELLESCEFLNQFGILTEEPSLTEDIDEWPNSGQVPFQVWVFASSCCNS